MASAGGLREHEDGGVDAGVAQGHALLDEGDGQPGRPRPRGRPGPRPRRRGRRRRPSPRRRERRGRRDGAAGGRCGGRRPGRPRPRPGASGAAAGAPGPVAQPRAGHVRQPAAEEVGQVPGHQALGRAEGGGPSVDVGGQAGRLEEREPAGHEGPDGAREDVAGPAVARRGDPAVTRRAVPPGSATTVVGPFRRTTAPAAPRQGPRRLDPVGPRRRRRPGRANSPSWGVRTQRTARGRPTTSAISVAGPKGHQAVGVDHDGDGGRGHQGADLGGGVLGAAEAGPDDEGAAPGHHLEGGDAPSRRRRARWRRPRRR